MDTLPDINRFFALVSQHERQLNTDNDLTVSIGSTIANSTISSKQNISDQVKKASIHPLWFRRTYSLRMLQEKYGYPPGYKPKNRQNSSSINQIETTDSNVPSFT